MKTTELSIIPLGNLVTEKDYKKNLFNLGKVSKKFYNIYLSEYVLGNKYIGEDKPSQVVYCISQLLTGTPLNFKASKGQVGSFNFADNFNSMILCNFDSYSGKTNATLSGKSKNPWLHCGEYIKISASTNVLNNALITQENKAWPFDEISKIIFDEYISDTISVQNMYPLEPEKWDDPQWQCYPCGMATYTLYGKDIKKNEISVSYSFYKPSI